MMKGETYGNLVDLLHEVGGEELLRELSEVVASEAEVLEDMGVEDDLCDATAASTARRVAAVRVVGHKLEALAAELARAYAL